MSAHRVTRLMELDELYDGTLRRSKAPQIRERIDCFEVFDDADFVRRFRLSKASCHYLYEKLQSKLDPLSNRSQAPSGITKLMIALRFYATGSFLLVIGDFCGVSESAVSKTVRQVSTEIACLSREFIFFPRTESGKRDVVAGFHSTARFPRVIGAIDCTHVRIDSPGGPEPEVFRNRKGHFSINMQVVCDYKLAIQDFVARWPGSSHDANIFNNSRLKSRLESGELGDRLLVGDRGYGCTPYLMTPLANPCTAPERLYNESQIRTRNAIERCFGVWKRRLPVLSLGVRIATKTKVMVIIACGVLHNIALMSDDALPEPELPIPEEVEGVDLAGDVPCRSRSDLINEYFTRL